MPSRQELQELKAESNIYRVVAAIGVLVCLVGMSLFGYQCVLWLRDGYWTELPLRYFFDPPLQTDWRNAQGALKIWNGILNFPAWLAIAGIGAALAVAMMKKFMEVDEILSHTRDR